MVNLISIWIVIISHKFLIEIVKLIKMFCLKLLKINLNIVLETIFFGIYGYILIEPIYNIFVRDVIIRCLNV